MLIYLFFISTDLDMKKSYSNRFFRYYTAMAEGKKSAIQHQNDDPSANCSQLYGTCPNSISDTINLDVLRIMQFLTRKFRVQFADTIAWFVNIPLLSWLILFRCLLLTYSIYLYLFALMSNLLIQSDDLFLLNAGIVIDHSTCVRLHFDTASECSVYVAVTTSLISTISFSMSGLTREAIKSWKNWI